MTHNWLGVLCAGTMVLGIAACSKKEGDAAPVDAVPPPSETAEPVPVAEAAPAPDAAATAAESVSVSKEAVIALSPADLWKKVGDFNGLNTWHPAISKSEVVKGNNNEVGAHRKLTLADGAVIVEELAARDETAMSLTYTIVEGPLPVTDYRATVSVAPEGEGKSKLVWSSTFKPAAGTEAAKAQEIIGGVYQAGLDNLANPAGG
jgi:mxaD protein